MKIYFVFLLCKFICFSAYTFRQGKNARRVIHNILGIETCLQAPLLDAKQKLCLESGLRKHYLITFQKVFLLTLNVILLLVFARQNKEQGSSLEFLFCYYELRIQILSAYFLQEQEDNSFHLILSFKQNCTQMKYFLRKDISNYFFDF